jgi:hypothetical protein
VGSYVGSLVGGSVEVGLGVGGNVVVGVGVGLNVVVGTSVGGLDGSGVGLSVGA